MTSRERWVIYPLLFFALCLGARGQIDFLRPREVEIPWLSCKVINAELITGGKVVAEDLRAGSIDCRDKLETESLRLHTMDAGQVTCNELVAVSPTGQRLAELSGTDAGAGRLTIFGADDQPAVVLTHQDTAGLVLSRHADATQLLLRATAGGGSIVILDAKGDVLGQWQLPLDPAVGGQDQTDPDKDDVVPSDEPDA